MGKDTKDVYVMCLFASFIILSTGFVVVNCLIKSIRMGEILSPIFVANVFASFVFIVRPIQILISINNINKIYAIGMYNKLGGGLGFNELPIVEASYIGLIGKKLCHMFNGFSVFFYIKVCHAVYIHGTMRVAP